MEYERAGEKDACGWSSRARFLSAVWAPLAAPLFVLGFPNEVMGLRSAPGRLPFFRFLNLVNLLFFPRARPFIDKQHGGHAAPWDTGLTR